MKPAKLVLKYYVEKNTGDTFLVSTVTFTDIQPTVGVPDRFIVANPDSIEGIFNTAILYDENGKEIYYYNNCNLVTIHNYMKYFIITFSSLKTNDKNGTINIFDDTSNQKTVGIKAPWDNEDRIMIRMYDITTYPESKGHECIKKRIDSRYDSLKITFDKIGNLNSIESHILNIINKEIYDTVSLYINIESEFEYNFNKKAENDKTADFVLNIDSKQYLNEMNDHIIIIYQRCEKTKQWYVKHMIILMPLHSTLNKLQFKFNLSDIIDLVDLDRTNNLTDNNKLLENNDEKDDSSFLRMSKMDAPWNKNKEILVRLYQVKTTDLPTKYSKDTETFNKIYVTPDRYFSLVSELQSTVDSLIEVENRVLDQIGIGIFGDDSMSFELCDDLKIEYNISEPTIEKDIVTGLCKSALTGGGLELSKQSKDRPQLELCMKYNRKDFPVGKYFIVLYEKDKETNKCRCILYREYLNTDIAHSETNVTTSLVLSLNMLIPFGAIETISRVFKDWDGLEDLEHYGCRLTEEIDTSEEDDEKVESTIISNEE